jgi:hypothetical protein
VVVDPTTEVTVVLRVDVVRTVLVVVVETTKASGQNQL